MITPTIDEVKALDGKIFAMLSEREMVVLNYYRDQGRKFGVALSIVNEADPVELENARSKEQADQIMKSANSRVSVFISTMLGNDMKDSPEIHAELNDFVRKDGHLVRITGIDVPEGCYHTSDGGLIGFGEVGADNVFLESEVYDELGGNLPDAVETHK
jgi:hypothetical protein